MTVSELKKLIDLKLTDIGLSEREASYESEILISHFSGFDRNTIIFEKHKEISASDEAEILNALNERLSHTPLQYIIGKWEFFGLEFFCGKGCLVPRPETEFAVEKTIEKLPENGCFLDLCTGSGCIAISVLKNRPDVRCVAVDISEDALSYARKNALSHGVSDRLEIIKADIFSYLPEKKADIIVSNPPYIKSCDMNELSPEVKCEPYIALDGGEDGLIFYRTIAERFTPFLSCGGYMIFEAGYDTTSSIPDILQKYGFVSEIINDYSGNPRICVARKSR